MNIVTEQYELLKVKRITSRGRQAQIAWRRQAYAIDRLYAWTGRHTCPRRSWIQNALEDKREFRQRVRRELATST